MSGTRPVTSDILKSNRCSSVIEYGRMSSRRVSEPDTLALGVLLHPCVMNGTPLGVLVFGRLLSLLFLLHASGELAHVSANIASANLWEQFIRHIRLHLRQETSHSVFIDSASVIVLDRSGKKSSQAVPPSGAVSLMSDSSGPPGVTAANSSRPS